MKSKKLICGIDVSKDTLDLFYNEDGKEKHLKVKNNPESHLELVAKLGSNRTYVMESTGVYGMKLAHNLKSKRADVRIENATVIKRFIQMNLERRKNDKKDAEWIYRYGVQQEPKVWIRPSKEMLYARQILSAITLYKNILVKYKNYSQGLEFYPFICKPVTESVSNCRIALENEISALEEVLDAITTNLYPGIKERLLTIPGFGKKVVQRLLIVTNGFKHFTNYRQLIAYAGLSVSEHLSGTSVVKKNRITKTGDKELRSLLYMNAISAIRYNKACKEQFERMKAAGKNGKAALIAVCCKLLKQAYAIATRETGYNEGYISTRTLTS